MAVRPEETKAALVAAAAAGIAFLESIQQPDGGFASEVSSRPSLAAAESLESVYLHAFVVHSLVAASESDPRVETIVAQGARYLEGAREPDGWWCFRIPSDEGPPADVDDTAVALTALLRARNGRSEELEADAEAWIGALEALRSESGLIKTWADPEFNSFQFELPDSAVNANLLLLQGLVGRPDPVLEHFFSVMAQFAAFRVLDTYFVQPLALPYLISRSYFDGGVEGLGPAMEYIASFVSRRRLGGDLGTALALVTLLNCGYDGEVVERAADRLVARQGEDGGWRSEAFFWDFAPSYYGARAFTTALAVEALTRLAGRGTARMR